MKRSRFGTEQIVSKHIHLLDVVNIRRALFCGFLLFVLGTKYGFTEQMRSELMSEEEESEPAL